MALLAHNGRSDIQTWICPSGKPITIRNERDMLHRPLILRVCKDNGSEWEAKEIEEQEKEGTRLVS